MAITASERKKTERFDARIPPELKAKLQRAAELRGCSVTHFVLNSAAAAADETIAAHEVLQVSARDLEAFQNAIAHPPVFDEKMRHVARQHSDLVKVVW